MRFREIVEDGIRQGVASALVVVHFHFPDLVDVHEVVEGLPRNTDTILRIALLDVVLRGPSLNYEG